MKKFLLPFFAFCVLPALLFSCHKRETIQTVSDYSFTNTTNDRVTFDVYSTKDDYNNNRNIKAKYYIEPGATQSISLEALRTYWIDWYSTRYTYNNWQDSVNPRSNPKPEITVSVENDHINIGSQRTDTSRSVLLNGDGTSSTWQLVIVEEPRQEALNGTYTFLFKKDFTGQYTFTNTAGEGITKPTLYYIQSSGDPDNSFSVNVLDEQKVPITRLACYPTSTIFGLPATGRDTLLMYFDVTGSLHSVIRQ